MHPPPHRRRQQQQQSRRRRTRVLFLNSTNSTSTKARNNYGWVMSRIGGWSHSNMDRGGTIHNSECVFVWGGDFALPYCENQTIPSNSHLEPDTDSHWSSSIFWVVPDEN
jgi:hypothetical protein